MEAIWLLQRQTDKQIDKTLVESEHFTIQINKATLHGDHTFILCSMLQWSHLVPNNFPLPKTLFQNLLDH